METADDVLLESLRHFYDSPKHSAAVHAILHKPGEKVSLRILDWLLTNYSKKHNVSYILPAEDRMFNMYIDYKSQLRSYSKRRFDVFKRRNRIHFPLADGTMLESTVAQLNLFRWALRNGVMDYCVEHLKDIERDMNKSMERKTVGKRKQLSRAAIQTCTKTPIRVRVSFD